MTNPYGDHQQPHQGQYPAGYGQQYPGGYGQQYGGYPGYGQPTRNEPLAIASLIISLVSIVFCGFTAIVGAILGHVAKKRIQQDPTLSGDGMATAGIVVGWIVGGLAILGTIAYFVFIGVMLSHKVH